MYFFLGLLNSDLAYFFQPEYKNMLVETLSYGKSWVIIIFGSIIAVLPDFFYYSILKIFYPSPTDKIVAFVKNQSKIGILTS